MKAAKNITGIILIISAAALSLAGENGESAPDKETRKVAVIDLNGFVEGVMVRTAKRRVKEALADGADILLFEVNSQSQRGFFDSGNEISDLISEQKVHTIVFAKNNVLSSAVMIALAAKELYIQPKAIFGAAAPFDLVGLFLLKGNGSETELETYREQMKKSLLQKYRFLCEKNGYNYDLVRNMIEPEKEFIIVVYKDHNGETNQIIMARDKLDSFSAKYEVIEPPDGWRSLGGGVLAINGEIAHQFGLGSKVAETREDIIETLKDKYAAEIGISFDDPRRDSIVTAKEYRETWWERFLSFIAQPLPRIIILMIGFLGIFIEIKTPGFGFPGGIGAACIFLFFFVSYLAALATWIEPIIFTIGVALILLEIFVIPGFGAPGISGILLMAAASVMAMQDFTLPKTDFQWVYMLKNAGRLSVGLIVFVAAAWAFAMYFPKVRAVSGHIIAFGPEPAEVHGGAAKDEAHANLVGQSGTAETALRPAGRAILFGKRYDVVTRGSFIDAQEEIVVTEVSGNRIVVKRPEN